MPAVTIRNLDPQVKAALQKRAALHGRSMEAEMRDILAQSVAQPSASRDDQPGGLGTRIHAMFADLDSFPAPERPTDPAPAVDFT